MSFSKLWEMVKDKEAWRAAAHGVTKSWTQLSSWTTTTNYSLQQGTTRKKIYWYSKWIDFKCEIRFTFLLKDKNLNIKTDLLCLWPPFSPLCALCTCIRYWANFPISKNLYNSPWSLPSNGQSSSQSFLRCSSCVIILKFGPSKFLNLFLRLIIFHQSKEERT